MSLGVFYSSTPLTSVLFKRLNCRVFFKSCFLSMDQNTACSMRAFWTNWAFKVFRVKFIIRYSVSLQWLITKRTYGDIKQSQMCQVFLCFLEWLIAQVSVKQMERPCSKRSIFKIDQRERFLLFFQRSSREEFTDNPLT